MLMHLRTKRQLDVYKKDLPQSLLLAGERGVGLLTAARWLTESYEVVTIQPMNKKSEPDPAGTITVDTIRMLYETTSGKRRHAQVIIIDDADMMSRGAQTAFLKLLEEPTAMTRFILTSHAPQNLLPTIRSRVQQVIIHPLENQQTIALLSDLNIRDATKLTQLQFIASGLPAELTRLTQDEAYFRKRAKLMADARELLQASTYDKLRVIHTYRDDRGTVDTLIDAMITILHRSVSMNPQPRLIKKLETLLLIQENIRMNMSVRLQLTTFVL